MTSLSLPIIIIAGPTAGGKTSLSLELATTLPSGGECICADSMQIYQHMDIGTAKPTPAEQSTVPHHLIDIVHPTQDFTVHDWLTLAEEEIAAIRQRNKWPLVVGGTNLYIKSLLEGMFDGPRADDELREQLDRCSNDELRQQLISIDPKAAEQIHRNDRRRTIRAIEVYRISGKPISMLQSQWSNAPTGNLRSDAVVVWLDYPAEVINPRINARVKQMIADGLVDEVRELYDSNSLDRQSREALGYKQLIAHFDGECSLEEAIEEIKIRTRRYAKQQRTWLRRFAMYDNAIRIDGRSFDAKRAAADVMDQISRFRDGACPRDGVG